MKKILAISLFFGIAAALFAQEGYENVFMLDAGYFYTPFEHGGGIGAGVKYERVIGDNYSIALGIGGMNIPGMEGGYFKLDVRPCFRMYLGADAPAGLFAEAGAGYTFAEIFSSAEERRHFAALTPAAGYKFMFGFFCIEISIAYVFLFDVGRFGKTESSFPDSENQISGKILLGFGF